MDTLTETFNKFWAKPFNPQGSAVDWILFLGFVLIVTWGWSRVIGKIVTD